MRFSLLGAGVIGRLRARAVARDPERELVAVADIDEAAAAYAACGTGARVFGDYRKLLEGDQADVVIVSTPVHLHEEMVVAALAAGKHVLCEKPLSNSAESCRRILACVRERGRTLAVGFNHRYLPSFRFLKQVIDEGRIGRVDSLRVFGGHDGLANFRAPWMYQKQWSGGGAMMDLGIHMTDLARFVLGEIEEVYGVAGSNVWKLEGSEDRALAILKSESGVPAIYEATWNEWKGYRVYLEAYGDWGMVRASYGPMRSLLITQDRPGGPRRRRIKRYPEVVIREKLRGWEATTQITFQEELSDFARRIRGEVVPLGDGWSGLRAVEIAEAVLESSASGYPVRLRRPS